MPGITSTISIEQFRTDWLDNKPIAVLCEMYTITKDQVIRLRHVWSLPLRHDRKLRHKPARATDPTPAEIRAACLRIQGRWDETTLENRRVTKTSHCEVRRIDTSEIDVWTWESDE